MSLNDTSGLRSKAHLCSRSGHLARSHQSCRRAQRRSNFVASYSCLRQNRASDGASCRSTGDFAANYGGGDGGSIVPPKSPTDESDANSGGESAEGILAKNSVDPSTLPNDIQEALRRGEVSSQDMELYLKIASTPLLGWICRVLPFIRERVMGNPRFLYVLAIEEIIGVTAKTAAEVQGRKEEFWNELQFVASDLALEIIGDFAVVCLLSPKKSFVARPTSGLGRAISSLPGHAFQVGEFTPAQRLAAVLYRGAQFFSVGFAASAVGHSLTKWGVEKKQRANPKKAGEEPYKPLAPVLSNSAIWGGFMGISTNVRYQLINGFEERVLDAFLQNAAAKNAISTVLRFGNTFWGGAQWVWYARLVGLQ